MRFSHPQKCIYCCGARVTLPQHTPSIFPHEPRNVAKAQQRMRSLVVGALTPSHRNIAHNRVCFELMPGAAVQSAEDAAEIGHLQLLLRRLQEGQQCSSRACDVAAARGHWDVVEALEARGVVCNFAVLMQMRGEVKVDEGKNLGWGTEAPVSRWHGVTCNAHGEVGEVDLCIHDLNPYLMLSGFQLCGKRAQHRDCFCMPVSVLTMADCCSCWWLVCFRTSPGRNQQAHAAAHLVFGPASSDERIHPGRNLSAAEAAKSRALQHWLDRWRLARVSDYFTTHFLERSLVLCVCARAWQEGFQTASAL